MERERTEWDQQYRTGSHGSLAPDPFFEKAFLDFIAPRFPDGGSALDAAGGVGRHSIYLAQHGWRVKLVDISEAGLRQARQNAGDLASRIDFEAADLDTLDLGQQRFDLVLVFFYLQRATFQRFADALRPGGLLIYKTYLDTPSSPPGTTNRHGPSHPMHLLKEGELLQSFPNLRTLHYAEFSGDRSVAELIAEKPRP
jgi:SAM-dependent methyltransferase